MPEEAFQTRLSVPEADQSLQGQAVNTTLNGGEQWVHEGGIATGTVINEKGWQATQIRRSGNRHIVNTGAEEGTGCGKW
ncbi:hypothetical protein DJICPGNB_22340 [Escherichia coli]|nr:hypothetical protein DJICPGNB_22340 [Escherichia coli]